MGLKNRRRQKKTASAPLLVLLTGMLAIPLLLGLTYKGRAVLAEVGRQLAVFSAVIQMPDSGIELIRERFQSELYGDWDKSLPAQTAVQPAQPAPAATPQPDMPVSSARENEIKPPKIPEAYAAPIISEDFSARDNSALLRYGQGLLKNDTVLADDAVEQILQNDLELHFTDTQEPQVLIVHTHATEAFERFDTDVYDTRNTWRSTDNSQNMVALGAAMAEVLEQNGIGVIHDTTQHDYPSYNGSYDRSAQTIRGYLDAYPGIKVVLDLHRDAMQRDDAIVKAVTEIEGQKAAQIMIIAACDDGTMEIPNWRENLRFAVELQDALERKAPAITRPVFFCYRKYNMDLTTGSLLLEFGSNANTLEEGLYSARLAGQALSDLINDHKDG